MSKMGQYITTVIDITDDCYVEDDAYWQSHEFGEAEYEEQPTITLTSSAWYDLDSLPPDVKQRLKDVGIEDYLLYDDVPF